MQNPRSCVDASAPEQYSQTLRPQLVFIARLRWPKCLGICVMHATNPCPVCFSGAQAQRGLDEELEDIAGELVSDLGATNNFSAKLSSTILGTKEPTSSSYLRCPLPTMYASIQLGAKYPGQASSTSKKSARKQPRIATGSLLLSQAHWLQVSAVPGPENCCGRGFRCVLLRDGAHSTLKTH